MRSSTMLEATVVLLCFQTACVFVCVWPNHRIPSCLFRNPIDDPRLPSPARSILFSLLSSSLLLFILFMINFVLLLDYSSIFAVHLV